MLDIMYHMLYIIYYILYIIDHIFYIIYYVFYTTSAQLFSILIRVSLHDQNTTRYLTCGGPGTLSLVQTPLQEHKLSVTSSRKPRK